MNIPLSVHSRLPTLDDVLSPEQQTTIYTTRALKYLSWTLVNKIVASTRVLGRDVCASVCNGNVYVDRLWWRVWMNFAWLLIGSCSRILRVLKSRGTLTSPRCSLQNSSSSGWISYRSYGLFLRSKIVYQICTHQATHSNTYKHRHPKWPGHKLQLS